MTVNGQTTPDSVVDVTDDSASFSAAPVPPYESAVVDGTAWFYVLVDGDGNPVAVCGWDTEYEDFYADLDDATDAVDYPDAEVMTVGVDVEHAAASHEAIQAGDYPRLMSPFFAVLRLFALTAGADE